ncbi:MAG: hypothetical protein Q4A88_05460, partial [Clostridia bacterium]|nr:hypothetical protein [Clostridia bacterium]
MKKHWTALLFIPVLLIGCINGTEPAVSSDPVATVATIEPTAIEIEIAIATPEPTAVATEIPTP